MSKRSLHLLLLLISWTALSGQTPGSSRVSKDTTRCYDPSELKAIALKLISGAECDTLLKVAKLTMAAQDTAIKSQAKTIEKQDIRYLETEHLVDICTLEKEVIKKDLKKVKRQLIVVKIGWAATAVIGAVTTVLALIH